MKTVKSYDSILKRFVIISILLLMLILVITPSLTVKADESYAEAWEDQAQPSSGKPGVRVIWYTTKPSITSGYLGQAVLVYLIRRDNGGAVAGTQPKLLNCTIPTATASDSAFRDHCIIVARDKMNLYPTVTSFYKESVPWRIAVPRQYGGILTGRSTGSNIEAIKYWLVQKTGTSTNSLLFVESLWGTTIANEFRGTTEAADDGKYLLVMVPVLAIKPLMYGTVHTLESKSYGSWSSAAALRSAIKDVSAGSVSAEMLSACKEYLRQYTSAIYSFMHTTAPDSGIAHTQISMENYEIACTLYNEVPSIYTYSNVWPTNQRDFWWEDCKAFVVHSSINLYAPAYFDNGVGNKTAVIGTSKEIIDQYVNHMGCNAPWAKYNASEHTGVKYFSGSAFV